MRRLAMGAEVQPGGGVHFRVWAPRRQRVAVVLDGADSERAGQALSAEGDGWFSGRMDAVRAGARYGYKLDDEDRVYPDPASRFQPEGPHGLSAVVDPGSFPWTDGSWRGVAMADAVIYEMHLGTFTPEGTWAAAMRELPELAALGVTVLEVMPVAEFPGRFGWGYDGVDLYAPTRLYGTPDDFRRFVDTAHSVGVAVILDVVYNHLGPDGNYLKCFSEGYFTERYSNEWGEAINFDGPDAGPVRAFFVANAGYWIDEYHLDGLRLDATQAIHDASDEHLVFAVGQRVREAARGRMSIVVAENESQESRLVRSVESGGWGLDGVWNDDYHHTAMVAMDGRAEAYYTDYHGSPQEFISAAKYGYLYQGQRYRWQKKRRGTPTLDIPARAFVTFLQNHDQVANSARGLRIHQRTSPGRLRAMTALTLLGPGTPMLFQGQEFAASTPFLFFADHGPELAALVQKGRAEFLTQFPSYARPEAQPVLADAAPHDPRTFSRCTLDFGERVTHADVYALHRDLLRLRREDAVFRHAGIDGAVLSPEAFVLRYTAHGGDRLLLVNLGRDLHLDPAPEPLLAPPEGARWRVLFSTENPRYGGGGTPEPDTELNWRLPGHAAMALGPVPAEGV